MGGLGPRSGATQPPSSSKQLTRARMSSLANLPDIDSQSPLWACDLAMPTLEKCRVGPDMVYEPFPGSLRSVGLQGLWIRACWLAVWEAQVQKLELQAEMLKPEVTPHLQPSTDPDSCSIFSKHLGHESDAESGCHRCRNGTKRQKPPQLRGLCNVVEVLRGQAKSACIESEDG